MSDAAEYQLLQRNLAHFPAADYLLLNAPKGAWLSEFARNRSVTLLDWMYDAYRQHQTQLGASAQVCFGTTPSAKPYQHVLLFWPKEKALVPYLLEVLSALPQTAPLTLWLCGQNSGGIKSAATLLKKHGLKAQKVDSARHCTLLCCQLPAVEAASEQTADALQAVLNRHAKGYPVTVNQQQLELTSYPGVFSQGELDSGTELLLANLPQLTNQRVVDFGCGSGVISCVLAQQFPQLSLLAVDVNAFALQASRNNFANYAPRGEARAVTGVADLASEQYDLIITNPPFHQGTKTDYDVTENLIQQAPQLLKRGGKLLMVANRFLKYPDRIQQAFGRCQTLAQNNRFSIYLAEKN